MKNYTKKHIDNEVLKFIKEKNPLIPVKPWAQCKRDKVLFKGNEIMVRKYIRNVDGKLPKLINSDTKLPINHRDNMVKIYSKGDLEGVHKYINLVITIYNEIQTSKKPPPPKLKRV